MCDTRHAAVCRPTPLRPASSNEPPGRLRTRSTRDTKSHTSQNRSRSSSLLSRLNSTTPWREDTHRHTENTHTHNTHTHRTHTHTYRTHTDTGTHRTHTHTQAHIEHTHGTQTHSHTHTNIEHTHTRNNHTHTRNTHTGEKLHHKHPNKNNKIKITKIHNHNTKALINTSTHKQNTHSLSHTHKHKQNTHTHSHTNRTPPPPHTHLLYDVLQVRRPEAPQLFAVRRQRLARRHGGRFRGAPRHVEAICTRDHHTLNNTHTHTRVCVSSYTTAVLGGGNKVHDARKVPPSRESRSAMDGFIHLRSHRPPARCSSCCFVFGALTWSSCHEAASRFRHEAEGRV